MKILRLLFAALACAGASLSVAVQADTLNFSKTPASNIVAEISRRYNVDVVFKTPVNRSQPVTFSVEDPDTPEGRLQAITSLANALGMDYQKVFVVSKIDPGTTVPEIPIDADAPVVFPGTKVAATDAIRLVAGVDDAIVQVSGAVRGEVTLPDRQMSTVNAAALIAKQTGTVWKAYYGFYKRGQAPAHLRGTLVGRTSDGKALYAPPLTTFRNLKPNPAPVNITTAQPAPTSLPAVSPNVTAVPNGYSPYGYNPYGYGYDPYGYGQSGPVSLYPSGSPALPGYEGPPAFGTTYGPTFYPGGTVLQNFPYSGGYGGPVMVGGY